MKKSLNFILCVFIIVLTANCSKNKQEIIKNTWQVESIKVHKDSTLQYPPQGGNHVWLLTFENARKYNFLIGSNKSFGKVKFKSKNNIDFEGVITYAMWDSKFSEQVFVIFSEINTYQLKKMSLSLTDENGRLIKFKKQ